VWESAKSLAKGCSQTVFNSSHNSLQVNTLVYDITL